MSFATLAPRLAPTKLSICASVGSAACAAACSIILVIFSFSATTSFSARSLLPIQEALFSVHTPFT